MTTKPGKTSRDANTRKADRHDLFLAEIMFGDEAEAACHDKGSQNRDIKGATGIGREMKGGGRRCWLSDQAIGRDRIVKRNPSAQCLLPEAGRHVQNSGYSVTTRRRAQIDRDRAKTRRNLANDRAKQNFSRFFRF
jgi:hypothetical protein